MNYSDLNNLGLKELKKELETLNAELYELRIKNKLGQLSNPLKIRVVKKDIARLNTAITSKKGDK
ncbi:MAG: 50S ribosomal protein L29 [Bdellovibrionaceae bacterium]|nr:50S ribosomal protein L29 [Pseudobdellovibrionaceae bacterium]NUM60230.1 50S ribosomal protein L29 [Pseudobdellovibrionaceae bacterium]